MDSEFTLIIIVRSILALVFLAAGIFALVLGGRLYLKGIGLAPDGSTVATKHGKLNIKTSLKTVGSVVMATSIAWGILAYLSVPGASKTGDDWDVPKTPGDAVPATQPTNAPSIDR